MPMGQMILELGAFEVPHPVTEGAIGHMPYICFTSEAGQEWQFVAEFALDTQEEAHSLVMEIAHYLETRPSTSKRLELQNQDMN